VEFQFQLKAYAEIIDRRMADLLPGTSLEPILLHEAMRYSCLAPGKRLRPALTMACAEALGSDPASVDDLPALDDDDLRRGAPTCHVKFGEAVAILAGDALFALAFDKLANGAWSADQRVRAIASLTKATGSDGLVGGETIDILSEGKPISAETLELIHRRKTGSLIAASCEIGAILAGADASVSARLYEYGMSIGLAFQIADDVLNETSTPEQLGKAAGSDRERGKATYPALYGLEASRQAALNAAARGIDCLSGLDNSGFLEHLARFSVERLN